MSKRTAQGLKNSHQQMMARFKRSGRKFVTGHCSACKKTLEVLQPTPGSKPYTGKIVCHHCAQELQYIAYEDGRAMFRKA